MAFRFNGVEPTAIKYNGTNLTVLKYGTTAVWGKPFSLTIQAGANSTVTVNRTSSPNQHASTGNITSGGIVYYGDTLTITATPASGYKLTKFTINGTEYANGETSAVSQTITITGAVSVVTTTGSATAWHVVWEGQHLWTTNFFRVQGSKVKVATGTLYVSDDVSLDASKRTRLTGYAKHSYGNPDRQDFSAVEIGNELTEVVAYQFTYSGKTYLNKFSAKNGVNFEYSTSLEQVPQTAGFMGFAVDFGLTKIEQYY